MKRVVASITFGLANSAFVLLVLSIIIFAFIRAVPGDPVVSMFGAEGISDAQLAELRTELGLDKPVVVQYMAWATRALHGDLGQSLADKQPVFSMVVSRLRPTIELALAAIITSTFLGIAVGMMAAVNRGRLFDYLTMLGTLSGISLPIFWVGILLIVVFSVNFDLLPTGGLAGFDVEMRALTGFPLLDSVLTGNGKAFRDIAEHMVLPVATLAIAPTALIARTARASILEVLHEEYVTAGLARGLSFRGVLIRHVLRNAMIPIITIIGLEMGLYLGGSIVTETVFSWPGLGRYLMEAVLAHDYPVIQGAILIYAVIIITVNFLVDLSYRLIDPRMRA